MNNQQDISVAVLSKNQDDVEMVNSSLRAGGYAAHCEWIKNPNEFDLFIGAHDVDLILINQAEYPDSIRDTIRQKTAFCPEVPVIGIAGKVEEHSIQEAMASGACDLVSFNNKPRLQAVVARELRAIRVERALNNTLTSVSEYRKQLKSYVATAKFAVADIQEGIIVNANTAWMSLFGLTDPDDVVGMPLMDYFATDSQTALKGALNATLKGKWQSGEQLETIIKSGDNKTLAVQLEFTPAYIDNAPSVQIKIIPPQSTQPESSTRVYDALKRDPTTLFLHRSEFLEKMQEKLATQLKFGINLLVYIKPDNFTEVCNAVGILNSEEILMQFAEEVRSKLQKDDFAGRFEGTSLLILIERGTERDAVKWAEQLLKHIEDKVFSADDTSTQLTCSIGMCPSSSIYENQGELVAAAVKAHAKARAAGGNTIFINNQTDEGTKIRQYDEIWVRYIKAALMDNRFRILQLPIAGLRSETSAMYDVLVRMIDESGKPVLPAEFLPAAERNQLSKTIDRWVLSAALEFCKATQPAKVFIRLSSQSIGDLSLPAWLSTELKNQQVSSQQIVLQVPEQEARKRITEAKALTEGLRKVGVGFAIEHFGVESSQFQILDALQPDYLKIDGQLMYSLTSDASLQAKVAQVVSAATERQILTVAERVENANTMAVLFQLGISYMQGHYVHEPDVVLDEAG